MDQLMTPVSIGNCRIRNRIVMAAASLCRAEDGFVSDSLLRFYEERAKGGTGLIIAGGAGIVPEQADRKELQIWDDSFCTGLRTLTETIHRHSSRVFLQLLHPGAYVSPALCREMPPMAPSEYQSGLTRQMTHAMTREEIDLTVRQYAAAARRAVGCGFDGIEICASVGYLLSSFLSAATNRRTDAYGGSLENRARLLLEVVGAVQDAVGPEIPLVVRLSGADLIPGGNTVSDTVQIAQMLERQGVQGLSITGGWHESRIPGITGHVPKGAFTYLAKEVRKAVSLPVIACGRLDPESGRKALAEGACTLVGFCRPLIADPCLAGKIGQGREEEIRHCISCNQECLDAVFSGRTVACTVNPMTGCREADRKSGSRRILVVGAGIAGMVFAALAARHHSVTVLEREKTWGGAAGILSECTGWQELPRYLLYLYQTCLRKGVSFRFRTPVTPEQVSRWRQDGEYDMIVLAVGASDAPLQTGCRTEIPVYTMQEYREAGFPGYDKLVILGNHYRAAQFATACRERQKEAEDFYRQWMKAEDIPARPDLACLGPKEKPFSGMAKSSLWAARMDAARQDITFLNGAQPVGIGGRSVIYRQEEQERELEADAVIDTGQTADTAFASCFSGGGDGIYMIGDAKSPGRIGNAVRDAWNLAQKI